jgi:hypothetical protein
MAKGDPCKHCGKPVNRHGLSCGSCMSALYNEKNGDKRAAWVKANADRVNARRRARWNENSASINSKQRELYASDPSKRNAKKTSALKWAEKNPDQKLTNNRVAKDSARLGITTGEYREMMAAQSLSPVFSVLVAAEWDDETPSDAENASADEARREIVNG